MSDWMDIFNENEGTHIDESIYGSADIETQIGMPDITDFRQVLNHLFNTQIPAGQASTRLQDADWFSTYLNPDMASDAEDSWYSQAGSGDNMWDLMTHGLKQNDGNVDIFEEMEYYIPDDSDEIPGGFNLPGDDEGYNPYDTQVQGDELRQVLELRQVWESFIGNYGAEGQRELKGLMMGMMPENYASIVEGAENQNKANYLQGLYNAHSIGQGLSISPQRNKLLQLNQLDYENNRIKTQETVGNMVGGSYNTYDTALQTLMDSMMSVMNAYEYE
jgi:hypothetical protein